MTPEQVAAERERFEAQWKTRTAQPRGPIDAWFWRAEIAHAENAELVAENNRLRERVRFHARARLKSFVAVPDDAVPFATDEIWKMACSGHASFLVELAEEAGVWFDDDGNEVPLAKWRARHKESN